MTLIFIFLSFGWISGGGQGRRNFWVWLPKVAYRVGVFFRERKEISKKSWWLPHPRKKYILGVEVCLLSTEIKQNRNYISDKIWNVHNFCRVTQIKRESSPSGLPNLIVFLSYQTFKIGFMDIILKFLLFLVHFYF